MKTKIFKLVEHAAIIISIMYFTFFIIDRVNSPMGFINNDITKVLLVVLGVFTIFNSVRLIGYERREEKRRAQARQRRISRR